MDPFFSKYEHMISDDLRKLIGHTNDLDRMMEFIPWKEFHENYGIAKALLSILPSWITKRSQLKNELSPEKIKEMTYSTYLSFFKKNAMKEINHDLRARFKSQGKKYIDYTVDGIEQRKCCIHNDKSSKERIKKEKVHEYLKYISYAANVTIIWNVIYFIPSILEAIKSILPDISINLKYFLCLSFSVLLKFVIKRLKMISVISVRRTIKKENNAKMVMAYFANTDPSIMRDYVYKDLENHVQRLWWNENSMGHVNIKDIGIRMLVFILAIALNFLLQGGQTSLGTNSTQPFTANQYPAFSPSYAPQVNSTSEPTLKPSPTPSPTPTPEPTPSPTPTPVPTPSPTPTPVPIVKSDISNLFMYNIGTHMIVGGTISNDLPSAEIASEILEELKYEKIVIMESNVSFVLDSVSLKEYTLNSNGKREVSVVCDIKPVIEFSFELKKKFIYNGDRLVNWVIGRVTDVPKNAAADIALNKYIEVGLGQKYIEDKSVESELSNYKESARKDISFFIRKMLKEEYVNISDNINIEFTTPSFTPKQIN